MKKHLQNKVLKPIQKIIVGSSYTKCVIYMNMKYAEMSYYCAVKIWLKCDDEVVLFNKYFQKAFSFLCHTYYIHQKLLSLSPYVSYVFVVKSSKFWRNEIKKWNYIRKMIKSIKNYLKELKLIENILLIFSFFSLSL